MISMHQIHPASTKPKYTFREYLQMLSDEDLQDILSAASAYDVHLPESFRQAHQELCRRRNKINEVSHAA